MRIDLEQRAFLTETMATRELDLNGVVETVCGEFFAGSGAEPAFSKQCSCAGCSQEISDDRIFQMTLVYDRVNGDEKLTLGTIFSIAKIIRN